MTAYIKIKRRDTPVKVSDEDGRIIKAKLSDRENTPRNLFVDLGDQWSGELGQIEGVEIVNEDVGSEPVSNLEKREEATQAEIDSFRNLSPEEKLKLKRREIIYTGFRTRYKLTHKQLEPSPELVKRAEEITLEFFTKNPKAVHLPKEELEPLLS